MPSLAFRLGVTMAMAISISFFLSTQECVASTWRRVCFRSTKLGSVRTLKPRAQKGHQCDHHSDTYAGHQSLTRNSQVSRTCWYFEPIIERKFNFLPTTIRCPFRQIFLISRIFPSFRARYGHLLPRTEDRNHQKCQERYDDLRLPSKRPRGGINTIRLTWDRCW
jgi:hypothetical protein